MRMTTRILLAAVVAVLAEVGTARAQDSGQDGPLLSWNSTSAGSLAARAPGRMVDAAIGRHRDAQARGLSRPNITETPDDPNLTTQIRIRVIQVLFQNLNAALLAFNNVIRAEAGFPPYLPTPITPRTGSSLP